MLGGQDNARHGGCRRRPALATTALVCIGLLAACTTSRADGPVSPERVDTDGVHDVNVVRDATDADEVHDLVRASDLLAADEGGADAADEKGEDAGAQPLEHVYAIKSINYPMQDVLAALPRLAERGLTLYLNTLPRHIGDAELGEVLEQARVLGVPVMLWPLLDPAEGAWCNEDNIEAFWANVFATLDFVDTLDHNVEIMVVNSELGPPKIDLIRQHFAEGAFGELIALIEGNIDRERFVRSAGRVAELVEELKGRGYGAQITTYPYLLDDMEDGDPDIQDAANVVLEGPAWDRLAFTPYSAAYSEDFARSFGPYFVYSYAQMARRRFGDRVDIALGLISPDNPRAYGSPEQLAADVAAAKAAGISRIDLFDLKGMLAEDRFDEWADALLAEPLTPPVEADTQRFHRSFSLMDSALDAYGE